MADAPDYHAAHAFNSETTMRNPFDWDYLASAPGTGEIFGPFSATFLLLFAGGFLGASYLYYRPWTKPIGTYVRRRAVIRASSIALWVFGVGLFFFLIRLLQINPFTFGNRIWMYLCFLAFLGMVALFGVRFQHARATTVAERAASARHRGRGSVHRNAVRRPVRKRRQLH